MTKMSQSNKILKNVLIENQTNLQNTCIELTRI